MKLIRPFSTKNEAGEQKFVGYMFFCPGCKHYHGIWITEPNEIGAQWTFDGNEQKPTFKPSILLKAEHNYDNIHCHLFITGGRIQYLGDCTHEYTGQTIDMWDVEDAGAPFRRLDEEENAAKGE